MKILKKRIVASRTNWPFKRMKGKFPFDGEEFEDVWSYYLSDPEAKVDKKLQIFTEPSIQGGSGSMFIYDESGKDRFDTMIIDFDDWCQTEFELATQSTDANDYARNYENYVRDLLNI